jgi:hypothetical protein
MIFMASLDFTFVSGYPTTDNFLAPRLLTVPSASETEWTEGASKVTDIPMTARVGTSIARVNHGRARLAGQRIHDDRIDGRMFNLHHGQGPGHLISAANRAKGVVGGFRSMAYDAGITNSCINRV